MQFKKLINKRRLSPVTLTKKEEIPLASVSKKLVDYMIGSLIQDIPIT